MNQLHLIELEIVERLGWTLIHSLWQILAIAAIYQCSKLILKTARARYVCGVACLALIAVLSCGTFITLSIPGDNPVELAVAPVATSPDSTIPFDNQIQAPTPLFTELENQRPSRSPEIGTADADAIAIQSPQNPASTASPPAVVPQGDNTWNTLATQLQPWMPTLVTGWLVGVVLLSIRPVIGWRYIRRVRVQGLQTIPNWLADTASTIAQQLKIRRKIDIHASTLVVVPMVAGFLKPMILIPASAITTLTPTELESILRHEMAHIRRHDTVINFLQTMVETLLFYHPATWWLSKQIRIERENCCDDLAVKDKREAISLAQALLRLEENRAVPAHLTAASGGDLKTRILRLLGEHRATTSLRKRTGLIAACVSISLALAIAGTMIGASVGNRGKVDDEFKYDEVVVKSYDDSSTWKQFKVRNPEQIAELLERFPEADQGRSGMEPAGYDIDYHLVFSSPDDDQLVIGVCLGLRLWSEGTGDWRVRDAEGLRALLNQLAEEHAEPDDAESIAWGELNAQGIRAGFSLEPQKKHYAVGESARVIFHFKNETERELDLTVPRLVQPVAVQWEFVDAESRATISTQNSQQIQWVAGAFGQKLAPGQGTTVQGPSIRFGGEHSADDEMQIFADVHTGQAVDVRFDLHNFMQLTQGCKTSAKKLSVVTGYREPRPCELVTFQTLEQLKDIDPATERLKFTGDRYAVDQEWTQVVAERFPQLWELDLGECRDLDESAVEPLSRLSNLRALRIKFAEKLPLQAGRWIAQLENLEILDISYSRKLMNEEFIEDLSKLSKLHTLIMLRHSSGGCTDTCHEHFKNMPGLRHVFVTPQHPLSSDNPDPQSRYQVHVVRDHPGDDYYSRDFVITTNPEAGLVMEASLPKYWNGQANLVPAVDVWVRVDGSGRFESSPLANRLLRNGPSSFHLEINNENYVYTASLSEHQFTLVDRFGLSFELPGHWKRRARTERAGPEFLTDLELQPGNHKLRVIFEGLGNEAKMISPFLHFHTTAPLSSNRQETASPDELSLQENLRLFEAEKDRLRKEFRGQWMVIAGDAIHGPFDDFEEADQQTDDFRQRLIFRPDLDDRDVEFPLSPFVANSEEKWIQLGRRFAKDHRLTISTDLWISNSKQLALRDDGRARIELSSTNNQKNVARHVVCSSLFQDHLVITENEVRDLGLSRYRAPGAAVYQKEQPGYKVWLRVAIPELEIDQHVLAYVVPDGIVKKLTAPGLDQAALLEQLKLRGDMPRGTRETGEDTEQTNNDDAHDLLLQARIALAAGQLAECRKKLVEAESQKVKSSFDSIDQIRHLANQYQWLHSLTKHGHRVEYNHSAAFLLLYQAQMLIRYGDYELAAELIEQAKQFPVEYQNPTFNPDSVDQELNQASALGLIGYRKRLAEVRNTHLKLQRDLNQQIGNLAGIGAPNEFRAQPYMEFANALLQLDNSQRIQLLEKWSRSHGDQVIVLCRMLFQARDGGTFRRPQMGAPIFLPHTRAADWPLEPLVIYDNVPFMGVYGYALAGVAEPAPSYLLYCLANCEWTTNDYSDSSKKALSTAHARAYQQLYLDEDGRKILAQQITARPVSQLDSKARQLGSWDNPANGDRDLRFNSLDYMTMADTLLAMSEKERLRHLEHWAWTAELNDQVIILCRMLFKSGPDGEFRRPGLGQPSFVDGRTFRDWPLEPITLVDGVPFVVVTGYDLGGEAEPASAYLDYCLENCEWTDVDFSDASEEKCKAALDALRESKDWPSDKFSEFFDPQTVSQEDDGKQWKIYGTVTDRQGNPIPGANVRVASGMATLLGRSEVQTDAQGNYVLRFGEGIYSQGANLQVAWVFLEKAGRVYHSNSRGVDLSMAMSREELSEEELQSSAFRWIQPDDLIVRGRDHEIDFVMSKPAEVLVQLLDSDGKPIDSPDVAFFDTNQTSEVCSIELSGEEKSTFPLTIGLRTGRDWELGIPNNGRLRQRSGKMRFSEPGRYVVTAQRFNDDDLLTLQIQSVVRDGVDVTDLVYRESALAQRPLSSELQEQARKILREMATANSMWLKKDAPVEGIDFQIQFAEAKPEDREPSWQQTESQSNLIPVHHSCLHILAADPEKAIIRSLVAKGNRIEIGYSFKEFQRVSFGNGILGKFHGYVSSGALSGVLTLDADTKTPLHHVQDTIGFVETFGDFVELESGRFVPLTINVNTGATRDWTWSFQVFENNLWVIQQISPEDTRLTRAKRDDRDLAILHTIERRSQPQNKKQ